MRTSTESTVTTQVYRVYIKATPQAVWDAITKPEWTERYGCGGRSEYDLRAGGPHRVLASEGMKKAGAEMGIPTPDVIVDDEVIETVVHDVEGAPRLAALLSGERESEGAGGGWSWVISSLKTLLETGEALGR
jgi:hypothetical protein